MIDTFKHILVPFVNVESARKALSTAVGLGQRFDSRLTMVCVNANEELKSAAEEAIQTIESRDGIRINLIVKTGKIYQEIVETATEVGADIIIMGAHGAKGLQKLFIGSNAYRVVSLSRIPVMTIRETHAKLGFDKIVMPLDDSSESRQKIPMVKNVAQSFNSKVFVLATSKWEDEETNDRVTRYAEQAVEMMEEGEVRSEIKSHFGGNIAKATMDVADEVEADLIIAMSEMEPSSGFFMGTNAQQLINQSEVPVLTLHAEEILKGVSGY